MLVLCYLDTFHAHCVMTAKELWFVLSSIKLFETDTAVTQVMALFLYSTYSMVTGHSMV